MYKKFIQISILLAFIYQINAQVGINTPQPDPSSVLEIISNDKGLLIPRISLSNNINKTTILNPTVSLLVYNTSNNGIFPNEVIPGFYYWSGSKWERLSNEDKIGHGSWMDQGTQNFSTSNSENIYQEGNVAVGTDVTNHNKLFVKTNNGNFKVGNIDQYLLKDLYDMVVPSKIAGSTPSNYPLSFSNLQFSSGVGFDGQ